MILTDGLNKENLHTASIAAAVVEETDAQHVWNAISMSIWRWALVFVWYGWVACPSSTRAWQKVSLHHWCKNLSIALF